jgi:hypothetical protein
MKKMLYAALLALLAVGSASPKAFADKTADTKKNEGKKGETVEKKEDNSGLVNVYDKKTGVLLGRDRPQNGK